jgi:hypothetical protein
MQFSTATRPARRSAQTFESEAFDFRSHRAPDERLFVALCAAYAPFGGVACGEDLGRLLADFRPRLAEPSLARLMADKEVFFFRWRNAAWLPLAQFRLRDLTIDDSMWQASHELGEHHDGWETAAWFVCPNDWLHGQRPVDLVDRDLDAVLQAARADRFVAGY